MKQPSQDQPGWQFAAFFIAILVFASHLIWSGEPTKYEQQSLIAITMSRGDSLSLLNTSPSAELIATSDEYFSFRDTAGNETMRYKKNDSGPYTLFGSMSPAQVLELESGSNVTVVLLNREELIGAQNKSRNDYWILKSFFRSAAVAIATFGLLYWAPSRFLQKRLNL